MTEETDEPDSRYAPPEPTAEDFDVAAREIVTAAQAIRKAWPGDLGIQPDMAPWQDSGLICHVIGQAQKREIARRHFRYNVEQLASVALPPDGAPGGVQTDEDRIAKLYGLTKEELVVLKSRMKRMVKEERDLKAEDELLGRGGNSDG